MGQTVRVEQRDGLACLVGAWDGTSTANAFLDHLRARAFSPATVRAYAFDLINLGRFLTERDVELAEVAPLDVFAWVDWQGARRRDAATVVSLRRSSAAPATVNRRVAAARGFFEYLVMAGQRRDNPVPSARRGQGIRPKQASGPAWASRAGTVSWWWAAGAATTSTARVAAG